MRLLKPSLSANEPEAHLHVQVQGKPPPPIELGKPMRMTAHDRKILVASRQAGDDAKAVWRSASATISLVQEIAVLVRQSVLRRSIADGVLESDRMSHWTPRSARLDALDHCASKLLKGALRHSTYPLKPSARSQAST